jgi:hypothetical protein
VLQCRCESLLRKRGKLLRQLLPLLRIRHYVLRIEQLLWDQPVLRE